jgi:hypothetical protein
MGAGPWPACFRLHVGEEKVMARDAKKNLFDHFKIALRVFATP